MNGQMHTGIAEATHLTQQGRLEEATAANQRALGGTFAPAAQEGPDDTNEPIEVISRLARVTPAGGRRRALRLARLRGGSLGRPCSPAACNSRYGGWKTRLGQRPRGRTLRRAFVHQQRRNPLLQTVHPERLHRTGRSPDRHAARLHPEPGRLRYGHQHERTRTPGSITATRKVEISWSGGACMGWDMPGRAGATPRLVHGSQRARCLYRDGAILRATP